MAGRLAACTEGTGPVEEVGELSNPILSDSGLHLFRELFSVLRPILTWGSFEFCWLLKPLFENGKKGKSEKWKKSGSRDVENT